MFDCGIMAAFEIRFRAMREDLLECLRSYNDHCVRSSLQAPTPEEIDKRREVYGTTLECLAVVTRLLSTVCDEDRIMLETETQEYICKLAKLLAQQSNSRHSWLFAGHESNISQSVISTMTAWEEPSPASRRERLLASRERYIAWNRRIRVTRGLAESLARC